jgi:hypothetical protein
LAAAGFSPQIEQSFHFQNPLSGYPQNNFPFLRIVPITRNSRLKSATSGCVLLTGFQKKKAGVLVAS